MARTNPGVVTPKLTNDQRRQALQKALASRQKRADFKKQVREQELTCSQALAIARNDDILDRILAIDFIQLFPSIGKAKAEKIMNYCSIAQTRRIRGLGDKQIDNLIHAIDYRAYIH